MGQDVSASPSISIDGMMLEATDLFTYLGSTTTNNLSPDIEIEKHIVKLSKRVWNNSQLTLCTKLKVICFMAAKAGQYKSGRKTA